VHRQNSTWNRQELYEKVWQFPLRKLADEYGISDVGLAKVCREIEIPLPGLGHWTKVACGHTVARPPLPAMENVPVLITALRIRVRQYKFNWLYISCTARGVVRAAV
jgi:hypothetical protein